MAIRRIVLLLMRGLLGNSVPSLTVRKLALAKEAIETTAPSAWCYWEILHRALFLVVMCSIYRVLRSYVLVAFGKRVLCVAHPFLLLEMLKRFLMKRLRDGLLFSERWRAGVQLGGHCLRPIKISCPKLWLC
jgi:hypothetical protein